MADFNYVNLEDPETREFARNDPKAFLAQYIQRVAPLPLTGRSIGNRLSYLQRRTLYSQRQHQSVEFQTNPQTLQLIFYQTRARAAISSSLFMDIWSPEKRSWVMSRIRGKNTKPERVVRSLLHRLGYRFTVNAPNNRKLPGRPDIVLPKWRTIILVHGCFWHGHKNCKHFRLPKTRTEWWREKIQNNRDRDQRNLAELQQLGWNVIVLWACEFDTIAKLDELTYRLPGLIEGSIYEPAATASLKVAEEPSDS